MEPSGLMSQGCSQVVLGAICLYSLLIIPCQARPKDLDLLRWVNNPPKDPDDVIVPLVPDPGLGPAHDAYNPTDLIPKLDRLGFVNDSPLVLRFYSASFEHQTTQEVAWPEMQRSQGNHEMYPDVVPSENFSVQGVVAATSFVGGLALSMSLCLLCCRLRKRIAPRLFDRQQLSNDSSSVPSIPPEPEEVKEAP